MWRLKRTCQGVDDRFGSGRMGANPCFGGEGPPPTARAFQVLERVVLGDHACHRVEVAPRIGVAIGVALRDLGPLVGARNRRRIALKRSPGVLVHPAPVLFEEI